MDPASAIFGVVGVISLGIQVSDGLIGYVKSVQGAPGSMRIMGLVVRSTCGILTNFHSLWEHISMPAEQSHWLNESRLEQVKPTIEGCAEIFGGLKKKLEVACKAIELKRRPDQEISLSRMERALWPMREVEMDDLMKKLGWFKQDLILHINLLNLAWSWQSGNHLSVELPGASIHTRVEQEQLAALLFQRSQGEQTPAASARTNPPYLGLYTKDRPQKEVSTNQSHPQAESVAQEIHPPLHASPMSYCSAAERSNFGAPIGETPHPQIEPAMIHSPESFHEDELHRQVSENQREEFKGGTTDCLEDATVCCVPFWLINCCPTDCCTTDVPSASQTIPVLLCRVEEIIVSDIEDNISVIETESLEILEQLSEEDKLEADREAERLLAIEVAELYLEARAIENNVPGFEAIVQELVAKWTLGSAE